MREELRENRECNKRNIYKNFMISESIIVIIMIIVMQIIIAIIKSQRHCFN